MPPLKFREIEVFWAVYKSESVKEASRLLNVSQPAVSMMLKSAEERFGIKLFDRSGGRVRPTPEARLLFDSTDNVFSDLKEFSRQLTRIREGRAGAVRVAAAPTLAVAFVHSALSAFRVNHPGIHVSVRTASSEQTLDLVAQGRIDLGVVYGPIDGRGTRSEDFTASEVGCIVRSDHRLAARDEVTPADLEDENVVTYREDTPLGRELAHMLRGTDLDLDISLQSSAFTAAHLAEQGFGVALIDSMILNSGLFPDLVVRPFRPTMPVHVQIVTSGGDPLSILANDLVTEIRHFMPARH